VTKSCYTSFGIKSNLISSSSNVNEFTIDAICPEITNQDIQEELRNPNGALLTLNTTIIPQNFWVETDDDKENKKMMKENAVLGDEESEEEYIFPFRIEG